MSVIGNEFAKMRHLWIGPIAVVLPLGIAGVTAFRALASGMLGQLDDPDGFGWKILLAGLGLALSLISPLVIAVLSSRLVEIEHAGNGWMLSSTSGATPGRLCRAKFASLGLIIVAATVLQSLILITAGWGIGISSAFPAAHWTAFTVAAVTINLSVLAFHIVLSAKVENQIVCLGVAVIGVFIAVFAPALPGWLQFVTPWGYYELASAAAYVGTDLVYLDIPLLAILVLAVVSAGAFALITARFDRQEE
ncbi:ABC transporter permease [Brevibacterium sandarakinum]|uniref:ABC transporter permease n=1 Tax=Brevibacterium sandarakinum TaxID=629680 RepID=UPI00264C98ED|nr:ABC transporter permease [Brevibacterium sandarakinum]MDN5658596.1 ABC transporter permease [Brevibacterium sandarakinum]